MGVGLTEEWARFFADHGFLVGVSIDGPAPLHDAYRLNRGGRGTHAMVVRGWEALARAGVETNILCTVNAANEAHGSRVYRYFRDELGARYLQFIPIVERVRAAAAACPRVVTFSQKFPSADVYGSQVRKEGEKIAFHVRTPRYERELAISTPGLFNVENALAAVAVAEAYGIPADVVAGGLVRAFVPGRMEHYVSADGQISVIVDYSHTGMSLQNALRSVRAEYPGRELTVLFGCTGGKGIDRREGMGNAAGEWADRIILTEDDPGPEEVEAICADIGVFLAAHGKDYTVIPNREAAVETAILGARRPAVVLLAGKGCEEAQKRKNGPEPCIPDGTLARRALDKYNAG